MKSKLQTEADKVINALMEESKPISEATDSLDKLVSSRKQSGYLAKLPKLLSYLTLISKRKTISRTVDLVSINFYGAKIETEVGLNCNGLGYLRYGSQLTSLCEVDRDGYTENGDSYQVLLKIFQNEDLCLEIADEILSKNRSNFLRLASFFRKQPIRKIEEDNDDDDENSKGIEVIYDDSHNFNEINIDGNNLNWRIKTMMMKQHKTSNYEDDLKLNDFLDAEKIIEEKDKIVEDINTKKSYVLKMIKEDKLKDTFVLDMIKPYEALENL